MLTRTELPGKLLEAWLYQKSLVMKRAGLAPTLMQWDRAVALFGDKMEKLASLVESWDVPAGLLMEAVFTAARKKGHSQGPFINQLLGDRFLRQSLADLLDVPMEIVMKKITRSEVIAAIERDYLSCCPSLQEIALADEFGMLCATSYSPSYRFYLAVASGSKADIRALAVDTVNEIESDYRMLLWLESRGIFFDTVAKAANAEQVGGSFVHQGVLDTLDSVRKLVLQDQSSVRGKTAARCNALAAELLRKAADLLDNT